MRFEIKKNAEPVPGYRLICFLGKGGWGEVWKASAPDGTQIAMKFLPNTGATNTIIEVRALQGMRNISHPNLLKLNQVWGCADYLVIAMELADGSLHDLLDVYYTELSSPIVPDHVCFFLRQAAAALDFLNTRQHIINGQRVALRHCDVKPSNMLLVGSQVKLADFSLVCQTSDTFGNHARSGTLDYAAPEVFQGLLSDRSDQFSLAVTYYQLRTGKYPFPPAPPRFSSRYVRPEPDLKEMHFSERMVLQRALSTVPQDRWPSCTEMMNRLEAACKSYAAMGCV